jgi:hypothetical protein
MSEGHTMLNSKAGGKSSDKNCVGKIRINLQGFSIQRICEDERDKCRMLQTIKGNMQDMKT